MSSHDILRPSLGNHDKKFRNAHGGATLIQSPPAVGQSILIVDRSDDSREVLRTVFQKRGLEIYEASEARTGLDLAQRLHPTVILLDLECEAANDPDVRDGFDAQTASEGTSLIVLGVARREIPSRNEHYVRKPYHYAPLIRTIEQLIDSKTRRLG